MDLPFKFIATEIINTAIKAEDLIIHMVVPSSPRHPDPTYMVREIVYLPSFISVKRGNDWYRLDIGKQETDEFPRIRLDDFVVITNNRTMESQVFEAKDLPLTPMDVMHRQMTPEPRYRHGP